MKNEYTGLTCCHTPAYLDVVKKLGKAPRKVNVIAVDSKWELASNRKEKACDKE